MSPQDFWDKDRRGGVADPRQAARDIARLTRAAHIGGSRQGGGPKASGERPGSLASGTSAEAVFKVIHHVKSVHGVRALAAYIGKDRDGEDCETNKGLVDEATEGRDIPLWNQDGDQLDAGDAQREVDSWELKSDAENLLPAARKAAVREGQQLTGEQRLRERQATHVMFSLPASIRQSVDIETFRGIATRTLDDTFGQFGHRYVYAIHSENGRPHVHALVRNVPDLSGHGNGNRLRLNKSDLDAIRQTFAGHCQEAGLQVTATRRVDRRAEREAILRGELSPKSGVSYVTGQNIKDARSSVFRDRQGKSAPGSEASDRLGAWLDQLKTRAPGWYQDHAVGYVDGQIEALGGKLKLDEPVQDRRAKRFDLGRLFGLSPLPIPEVEPRDPLKAVFRQAYTVPTRAEASFVAMYREDKRLATWSLEKRPETFGRLRNRGRGPDLSRKEIHAVMRNRATATVALRNPKRMAAVQKVIAVKLRALSELTRANRAAWGRRATAAALAKLSADVREADPQLARQVAADAEAARNGEASSANLRPDTDREAQIGSNPTRKELGQEPRLDNAGEPDKQSITDRSTRLQQAFERQARQGRDPGGRTRGR